MTHAYADCASHEFSLRLERQAQRVALEIEDDGTAFDPLRAGDPKPAASIEDARIGG